MAYPEFDLSRLQPESSVTPAELFALEQMLPLDAAEPAAEGPMGGELVKARNQGGAVIALCEDGVLLTGVALHLIDLMERGLVTHLCLEPLGALYDWELAHTGRVTGAPLVLPGGAVASDLLARLHACVAAGDAQGLGYGESLGWELFEGGAAQAGRSLLAQAYRWGVPVTVHAAVGGDLLQVVPSFDPAVFGRAASRDFRVLCHSVENLEQGAVYQFGRTDFAVEAFFTALVLARNVAAQYRRTLTDFTAGLWTPLPAEEVAAVAQGRGFAAGLSITDAAAPHRRHLITGDYRRTIPALRTAALESAGWRLSS